MEGCAAAPRSMKYSVKVSALFFLSYNSLLQEDGVPHEVKQMAYTKLHPKEQNL